MRRFLFVATIAVGAVVCATVPAHALSLTIAHSGNGPAVFAEVVQAGFLGPDGLTSDLTSLAPTFEPPPLSFRNSEGEVQTASSFLGSALTPDLGDGSVSGGVDMTFIYGTATTSDTLIFRPDVAASALSAQDSSGAEQDAIIRVRGTVDVFIDAGIGGAAPGEYVGDFTLPAASLPSGLPTGVTSMATVTISSFSGGLLASSDGTTPLSVPLHAGDLYSFVFEYGLLVPHGIDPPATFEIFATLDPLAPVIPEPATALLLAAGLGGLAVRRAAGRTP